MTGGLFVRGDHAIAMAKAIRRLQKFLAAEMDDDTLDALRRLSMIADIVEQEVIA